MTDERTISVRIADEDGQPGTRHFNVDNVAYLEAYTHSLTQFTWGVVVAGALVVAILTEAVTDRWLLAIVLGAVVVYGTRVLKRTNNVAIGTVTTNYAYAGESIKRLESAFTDASLEYQTLTDDLSDRFVNEQYHYHFVPDNIVSVAHVEGRVVPIPTICYAIGGAVIFVTFVLDQQEFFVYGIAVGVLALLVGYVVEPYENPDELRIELQSGERKAFTMTREDCRAFLREYNERR